MPSFYAGFWLFFLYFVNRPKNAAIFVKLFIKNIFFYLIDLKKIFIGLH